jgi:hypothetical protein
VKIVSRSKMDGALVLAQALPLLAASSSVADLSLSESVRLQCARSGLPAPDDAQTAGRQASASPASFF